MNEQKRGLFDKILDNYIEVCERTIDFGVQPCHSLMIKDGPGEFYSPSDSAAMEYSFPLWGYQFVGGILLLDDNNTIDSDKFFLFCFDISYHMQYCELSQAKMKSATSYQFNRNTQKNVDNSTKINNFQAFLGYYPGAFFTKENAMRAYSLHLVRSVNAIMQYPDDTEASKSGTHVFSLGPVIKSVIKKEDPELKND